MDPGQASVTSGSRRAAGNPPSDERVRADPRQRGESPEGEAPPAPGVDSDGDGVAPPPAVDRIAPVVACAAGAAEIPPIVEPLELDFDWGDQVLPGDVDEDDDLAVEILPPEEDETDAAAEKMLNVMLPEERAAVVAFVVVVVLSLLLLERDARVTVVWTAFAFLAGGV